MNPVICNTGFPMDRRENPTATQSGKRQTVLVVDDDPIARDLIAAQLEVAGHPVLLAADAPEALSLLHEHNPPIVILDWVMPRMDGLELCRAIRDVHDVPMTYVIMLTVNNEKAQLIEAFDAGVDDFLVKPFDAGELMARLRAGRRILRLHSILEKKVRQTKRLNASLAKLNADLRQLATVDDLTGAYNRREGMRRLEDYWQLADRYGHSLSCAIVDVDKFKAINDTQGHPAGDAALRRLATVFTSTLRTCDVVSRWGGDEFVLIFPNTPGSIAAEVVTRCRAALSSIATADEMVNLTFSAGIAERRDGVTSATAMLQQADAALYTAKNAGRNMVHVGDQNATQLAMNGAA